MLAHATSPFIRAETVADALRKVVSGEYDSAFSAEKIQTFAWYEGRPLNYSPENIPRTQTIEPVYIETSAFFIFPRALWTGRHRRIGDRPYMAVVDRIEGLDIDYPEDFTMARSSPQAATCPNKFRRICRYIRRYEKGGISIPPFRFHRAAHSGFRS
ncbi:MAG: hypothetical protein ACLRM8_10080 [Alistipes sp.]